MRRRYPPCGFALRQTPCGKPAPRELDGRALCDDHILYIMEQRAKMRRKRMSAADVEVTLRSLQRDIEAMKK